jgi:hypothetical protein
MPYSRGAIDLDLAFDMMPWWNELTSPISWASAFLVPRSGALRLELWRHRCSGGGELDGESCDRAGLWSNNGDLEMLWRCQSGATVAWRYMAWQSASPYRCLSAGSILVSTMLASDMIG